MQKFIYSLLTFPQTSVKKGVTSNTILMPHLIFITILTITTCCKATSVSNKAPVPSLPELTEKDKNIINSLSTGGEIPAWVICHLYDKAVNLNKILISNKIPLNNINLIKLNQLLADSDKYKATLIAIKSIFAKSTLVDKKLQMPPEDHFWSVILFDSEYLHPIQIFTSADPTRFKKGSNLYLFGYYLTNRNDSQVKFQQNVVIPVFVGTLLEIKPSKLNSGGARLQNFLISIISLTLIYVLVRIYISKTAKKEFNHYHLHKKGISHADSKGKS